ncbi:MAG: CPBP family intramembrane metalloprotease [Clostridia bacterium]|nr:CPBP family intramembrane metalloprotease [Clostridia bacterium]
MRQLYHKEPIWFAVLWIVIYVIGFSTADGFSESIGTPKLITVILGIVLVLILTGFIRGERLEEYYGLCGIKSRACNFAYFIPLAFISSVNLWFGLRADYPAVTAVLSVISMCLVGVLEEIIFRGLLFKAMSRDGVKAAVIVSSLTFGFGHIINLLLGAPVFETVLQLIYASAIGFCYTAVFLSCGSIVPCIISHALVNSLSVFAAEPSSWWLVIIAVVQTIVSIVYGIWLLRKNSISLQAADKS